MQRKILCAFVAAAIDSLAALHSSAAFAVPQSTAFTYQGQLNNGSGLADGSYQFTFTLYDDETSGNVVGFPIYQTIDVINGSFTTDLDFGAGPFAGQQRWLDIMVGTTGANEQELSPRQPVNAAPVAQYALTSPARAQSINYLVNATTTANEIALGTIGGFTFGATCQLSPPGSTNGVATTLLVENPVGVTTWDLTGALYGAIDGATAPTTFDYDLHAHAGGGTIGAFGAANGHKSVTYTNLFIQENNTGLMLQLNLRIFSDANTADGTRHCEITGLITPSS